MRSANPISASLGRLLNCDSSKGDKGKSVAVFLGRFWQGAVLGLGLVAWSGVGHTADAPGEGASRWRMATSWSAATPVLGETAARFAEQLRSATRGRLELRIEEPAQHKSPQGVLEMVRSGSYEIGFTASHFSRVRETPLAYFAAMSFGMSEAERLAWLQSGGGLGRLQETLSYQGLQAHPLGNLVLESGLWTRRELKSIEELRGLRLRAPGELGAALKRLGVRGVALPLAELSEAFAQNRVDALEWPGAAETALLMGQGPRYFYPAWQDPAAEVFLLVNREKYASLPADLQTALAAAIKALAQELQGAALGYHPRRLEKIAKAKVELRALPRELAQALRDANEEALREQASRSAETDEAYQERQAFLARWRDWARQGLAPMR